MEWQDIKRKEPLQIWLAQLSMTLPQFARLTTFSVDFDANIIKFGIVGPDNTNISFDENTLNMSFDENTLKKLKDFFGTSDINLTNHFDENAIYHDLDGYPLKFQARVLLTVKNVRFPPTLSTTKGV